MRMLHQPSTRLRIHHLVCYSLVLWCLGCLGYRPAQAQDMPTHQFTFQGEDLSIALNHVAEKTNIDLVFSNRLTRDKEVYCIAREYSIEQLLRCMLEPAGLDFIRSSSGTYIVIRPIEKDPFFGDLAGVVVDGETGDPLPYANILLADASASTVSNSDGYFSLASLLEGLNEVVVTYVGYESNIDSIYIAPGDRKRVRIEMQPATHSLDPVVIESLEQRLPSMGLGEAIVAEEEVQAMPFFAAPDVIRGTARLTGVAVQQPVANVHIQGGASGEHLTLLDGVPVRDPVSLGRYLGAFSPLAINRITVQKAGFGAHYGSHLAGVVSVEHDLAFRYSPEFTISVDPVSVNGKAGFKVNAPRDASVTGLFAVRSSNWGLYQDPGIESLLTQWNNADPLLTSLWLNESVGSSTLSVTDQKPRVAFSDVHGAVKVDFSPFHKLELSLYRAGNQLTSQFDAQNVPLELPTHTLMLTRDEYEWVNWAGRVRHSWVVGSRSALAFYARGSWHNSNYLYLGSQQEFNPDETDVRSLSQELTAGLNDQVKGDEWNEIRELAVGADFSHSFSSQFYLDLGVNAGHTESHFLIQNPRIPRFYYGMNAWDYSAHVTPRISLGVETYIEPGVRLTYLPERSTLYAEPRIVLRSDKNTDAAGALAFRLAGGLYRQFINQYELTNVHSTAVVPSVLFWLPNDKSLAPPSAIHLATDVLWKPVSAFSVIAELFSKWQSRILTLDYDQVLTRANSGEEQYGSYALQKFFIGVGTGRTHGASLRGRYETNALQGSVTYNYTWARRSFPGRFDEQEIPVPWNVPHRVMIETEAELTEGLNGTVRWQGGWGQRWALRQAYYDYFSEGVSAFSFEPFDLAAPGNHELPAFSQLDLGLSYDTGGQGMPLTLSVYLLNVLDKQNVYDYNLSGGEGSLIRIPRVLPGRHVSFGFKFQF